MTELSEFETETALIAQLRAIAGAGEGAHQFELARPDSPRIQVSYSSGSGSSVSFEARCGWGERPASLAEGSGYRAGPGALLRAPRPMGITLRVEDPLDRMAKLERVAREFQTGDPVFDDAVYVETGTADAVLREVLNPAVRGAVLALRSEGIRRVIVDDERGRVCAHLYQFAHVRHDDERGHRILEAFESLARAIPEVASEGTPARSRLERGLEWTAILLFWGGLPVYAFGIIPARCTEVTVGQAGWSGPCGPLWKGLALGVLLGFAAAFVIHRSVRGGSDSHKIRGGAAFGLWFVVLVATLLVTGIVGWHL
jgi:hypothetical protein